MSPDKPLAFCHQRTHLHFFHSAEQQPLNVFSSALLVSAVFHESSRKIRNQSTKVIQLGLWKYSPVKTFQQYFSTQTKPTEEGAVYTKVRIEKQAWSLYNHH